MANQIDDRSLLARAYGWATGASTIAIEMVVPILIGAWIDRWLGTKGAFSILGAAIGVTTGIWSLLHLVEPLRRNRRQNEKMSDRLEHPHERHP